MFARNSTQKKVRRAVKTTKTAVNRAIDRVEPSLESAAVNLEILGRDGIAAARKHSSAGLDELRSGYASLEKRARKMTHRAKKGDRRAASKLALIAAGAVALVVGVLR